MKYLTLFPLGLVLTYIPGSLSQKQCFSQSLKPSYPCCKGKKVVFTDENGEWGIENGKWCGIGNGTSNSNKSDNSCFSVALGYPCCKSSDVYFTDNNGDWGIENGKWCGVDKGSSNSSKKSDDSCFSITLGYPCCKSNDVYFTDDSGEWGVEDGLWCGIGNGFLKESDDFCFADALGYPCCKSCDVYFTDESGDWGIENKEWCGIKDSCHSDGEMNEDPVKNVNATNTSKNDFEFSFLKMENNKKNILYSPLSIEYALKMLQEGADKNTYNEINKIIGNAKLPKYTNIGKNLSLANGIFIKDKYYQYVKTEYINTLKKRYDAEVQKDPFNNVKNVNKWIEDKTLGIIKNMLSDDIVKNQEYEVLMFIINALAIDMEWVRPFDLLDTEGDTFYLDNGKKMTATMMKKIFVRNEDTSFYKNDDINVLTMNLEEYNGTQFEFMAIMPNKNLSSYVENVTKEQISEIDKNLIASSDLKRGINLKIPKFKFNYSLNLKQDLMKLGIKDVFNVKKANLSKIADEKAMNRKVYISDALHKADIEFNEKGVKAAAVTVVPTVMELISSFQTDETIYIDKPFMFIIRDKQTKDIWFTGTVYEPNSWANDAESYKPKRRGN